jgi:hypothetical protein
MERLIIDIPKTKSTLVKQILRGLGVTIQQEIKSQPSAYKKKISQVSGFNLDRRRFESFRRRE